jgi:hypothetical protein
VIRIERDGKELDVTPLRTRKVLLGTSVIYDAADHGRSWFFLDLWLPGPQLKTATGGAFKTADGKAVILIGRHGQAET